MSSQNDEEEDIFNLCNKILMLLNGHSYGVCASALMNLIIQLASELPNSHELLLRSSAVLLQAAKEYKDKKTSE